MDDIMTGVVYSKYEFTPEELLTLSRQMARADATVTEKLDTLKSVSAQIKADIASQEQVMHSCAEKVRSGYGMRPRQCQIKYGDGVAQYIDVDNGEVVQERPMTKDEQLKLH